MNAGIRTGFLRQYALHFCIAALLVCVSSAEAAVTVTQVSAGFNHSLFIESDGSLWGMGNDGIGQLGDGSTAPEQDFPVLIVASNVMVASAGSAHSCFVTSNQVLWGMGANSSGQLGLGALYSTNIPIPLASNVVAVSCGGLHTLFVKSDGSLWGMGDNTEGQLGTGNYTSSTNMPVEILASNVVAVSAGNDTSLFLKSDGSLWSMGFNGGGQLGIGSTILKTNTPQEVLSGAVYAFSCGEGSHCLFVALPGFGRMSAMGSDFFGQLGDGQSGTNSYASEVVVPTDVVAVGAGAAHSAFIKTDGSLWVMGRNQFGQINCTGVSTNRPTQILSSGVVAVSAGGNYNLFIKSDGTLWGMGADDWGQLGIGRTGDISCVPIRIVPPLALDITTSSVAQTNLVLHGTNDFSPGFVHVLMTTNSAAPLNQWTSVWTNAVGAGAFNIIVTNGVDPQIPQRYYRLQLFQIN